MEMVYKTCEYTWCHRSVQLGMVKINIMLCIFYNNNNDDYKPYVMIKPPG